LHEKIAIVTGASACKTVITDKNWVELVREN